MRHRLIRAFGLGVLMGASAASAEDAGPRPQLPHRFAEHGFGYVEQVPDTDRDLPPHRPAVREPGYIDQVSGETGRLVPKEDLEGVPADAHPDAGLVDESGFEWYRPVPDDVSAYARQIYIVPLPRTTSGLPRCLTTMTADQLVRLAPYCVANR